MEKRKGAILGYVYTALQAVVAIMYIPILLNNVGAAEYGLYQMLGSFVAYLSTMELPLSASIIRYYSKYKENCDSIKMENTLALGQRIFYAISVVFVITIFPIITIINTAYSDSLSNYERHEAIVMIIFMVINLIINMISYVYIAAITANERFVFLKIVNIVSLLIQPVAVLCFLFYFPYALTIVIIQLVINIVLFFVRKYYALNVLKCIVKYHGFDKQLIKNLLSLSTAVLVVVIADQIFWRTDQLIIGAYYGTEQVAVYSIGAQFNSIFISVGGVLSAMLIPVITRISQTNDKEKMALFFRKIGRFQSFLLSFFVCGVILFGKEFIFLIAGEGYELSYTIALLLMVPYSIGLIQNSAIYILQIYDKYYYRAYVMISIAIINIILTLFFISKWGIVGAALSTTIVLLLGDGIIMNILYSIKFNLKILSFFISVLPIWTVACMSLLGGMFINMIVIDNLYLQLFVHVIIYSILFFILQYYICAKDDEKSILKSIICK